MAIGGGVPQSQAAYNAARRVLPCPFCGGDAEVAGGNCRIEDHFVKCKDCGAKSEGYPDVDDVRAVWNRRHAGANEQAPASALLLLAEILNNLTGLPSMSQHEANRYRASTIRRITQILNEAEKRA